MELNYRTPLLLQGCPVIQQQQQQKKQFGEIKKKETDKPLEINGIDSPIFEGLAVCQESKETGQKIFIYISLSSNNDSFL